MTFPLIEAPRIDAGGGPDRAGGPDRSTGGPDGSTGGPDGSTGRPDGSTGRPDGSTGRPDGSPGWTDGGAGWADGGAGWADGGAGWADGRAQWRDGGPDWAAPGGTAGQVFVGRSRELDRLDGLLADAAAGRPQIVLVEGEAGLGKSSLITEFLTRHREMPVLAASGEVSEQALPWGMVRQLAHRADSGLLPAFPLLAGGPVASANPLSVGEELLALFAARSASGGLAVVIEDLQWADQPSARALLFACRRLDDEVLVVVSGRPQRLGRLGEGWTRFLAGDRRCSRLALTGLGAAELAELAAALGCGDRPGGLASRGLASGGLPGSGLPGGGLPGGGLPGGGLSGRAVRRVAEHSRGNPMFARAMLTELPGHVLEGSQDGLYLPGSLSAVVLPRLAALPADARNLVIAASVLGEHCAASDAAVLAGVPQSDNALDQAVAAGFLVAQPEQRELRFAHELIRRAVYGDIGTAKRRSLHRWAAALTDGSESLRHRVAAACRIDQRLALELDAAAAVAAARGETGPAAAYLVQAAELGARGPERAGRLLSAFELLVRTGDASGADSLRRLAEHLPPSTRRDTALGQLAMLSARPAAAEALFLAAWSAHRRMGAAAWARTGTAGVALAGAATQAEASAAAEAAAEAGAAAEAAVGLALHYGNALSLDECRMWTRRSMRIAAGAGNGPPAVLATQAMARAMAGEAAAALQMLSFLPGAAALVPDSQADALTARGMLRLWTDDLAGADDDLTAVVTRIRGGLRLRYPGQALGYLAEVAFRLGRWDEAQGHAELAVSMAEEAGRTCDLPFAHNLATRVAALRGEWERASAHAGAAEQAARAAGTGSAMVFAAAARGALGFARDDPAEVLHGISSVPMVNPAESCDDPTAGLWRPARIWALVRAGRLDEADAALAVFEAGAADGGARDHGRGQAVVHCARLRASVALARGKPEQAEGILEACSALADGLRDPIARALFDVEYGRCLARAHRRPAALARLRSAHEVLVRLGARPFADAVAAELAALGVRGGPDADSALAGLTAQELQVARLVADGLSNREVAAQLYLSPKTIEYHLAHIFAKLGIRTRYQLGARIRPGTAALAGSLGHGQPGPGRSPQR